jgi:uncharacterized membrane protein YhaH (DUF805 family)
MRLVRRRIGLFDATVSPRDYFALGLILTLLKQVLDRLVATRMFGRPWSLWRYALTGEIGGLFSLNRDDQIFYASMLAVALPFIVIGVVLTVQRLRDAGWPLWYTLLFFAPLPMNVIFFIIFCLMPSKPALSQPAVADMVGPVKPAQPERAAGTRPHFNYLRALVAILIPLPVAWVMSYLGTHILRDYGWSMFVGLPFVLPMLSMVIYGAGREVNYGECFQLGSLWILLAFGWLTVAGFEGLICIVMLLPLAVPIVMLGVLIGYMIIEYGPGNPDELAKITTVLFAVLPAMFGAEHLTIPDPSLFTCETAVVVNAPPEVVWRYVVSFTDLAPPDEWIFRTGLAYPIRARIEGSGVGAVRRCEFSTGEFIEPIEVWDEPRLLKFAVTQNPPPMREWNPLFDVHPPHLDGFLISKSGQFLLTPLAGSRTILKGSTLYQHGLWPAEYWRLWSDPIIHRIHDRVLRHVKKLAELDETGRDLVRRAGLPRERKL